MESFLKNAITKKILISVITIIMVSNFIMPNYVHAADGGKLFKPVTELLLGIADRVLATMQTMFVGDGSGLANALTASDLSTEGPTDAGADLEASLTRKHYSIRYSPAIIFSGKVPAFDINYIAPMTEDERKMDYYEYKYDEVARNVTTEDLKNTYGFNESTATVYEVDAGFWQGFATGWGTTYIAEWTHNGKQYYFVNQDTWGIADGLTIVGGLIGAIVIGGVTAVGSLLMVSANVLARSARYTIRV